MREAGTGSVVVVGGGAAGTLVALQLLRRRTAASVTLVERGHRLATGIAYGTREPAHLLNVRCRGMAAWPDDPDHFTRWAVEHGAARNGADFVPRSAFGAYLGEQLELAARESPGRLKVAWTEAVAIEAAPRPVVELADGSRLPADHVVLCTGNRTPRDPAGLAAAGSRYVADPWSTEWLDRLGSLNQVLLVGTGLTAVDVVLSLRARGRRGKVLAVSRHGWLPGAHTVEPRTPAPPAVEPGSGAAGSARRLVQEVRRAVARVEAAGGSAQDVVDGLRPVTVALWQGLSRREQEQLLRHVARRWEVQRHRMAPAVAEALAREQATGRLAVQAAEVLGCRPDGDAVVVSLRHRHTIWHAEVAAVVNCTGPSPDPTLGADPLLANLLATGRARRHPLGLGIDVGDDGVVLDARGTPSGWLWALGALRKGAEWESTAVPELRQQAAALADRLAGARPGRSAA